MVWNKKKSKWKYVVRSVAYMGQNMSVYRSSSTHLRSLQLVAQRRTNGQTNLISLSESINTTISASTSTLSGYWIHPHDLVYPSTLLQIGRKTYCFRFVQNFIQEHMNSLHKWINSLYARILLLKTFSRHNFRQHFSNAYENENYTARMQFYYFGACVSLSYILNMFECKYVLFIIKVYF